MRGNAPAVKPLHHYSTSEQVVGTWIDGKPLYERTVVSTAQITTSVQSIADTTDWNIDTCILENVTFRENGFSYQHTNGSLVRYNAANKQIETSTTAYTCNGGCIVVVRYTKTTDTAPSA